MTEVQSPFGCFNSEISEIPIDLKMTIRGKECNVPDNSAVLLDPWSVRQSADSVSTPSDLVSLAWLQKGDILQIAPLDGEEEICDDFDNSTVLYTVKSENQFSSHPVNPCGEKTNPSNDSVSPVSSGIHILPHDRNGKRPSSANGEHLSSFDIESPKYPVNGQGLTKPNYSYTHLIFMAIESTPQKCMTVNQIYNWCESNFPFYRHAGAGWKNSLRHNLSINKSFKRLPRDSRGPGRGAFWTVEPRERSTLMDAIKRNPWNFANMTGLSHQSEGLESNISSGSNFGVRRFGLARSAPSQLLRSEGLGQFGNHNLTADKFNGMGPNGPIRILCAPDGRIIATCDNSKPNLNGGVISSATTDGATHANGYTIADSRYWSSPSAETTSTDGANAEVEWPAEEEEKYLSTLRLLVEADDVDASDSNATKTHSDQLTSRLLDSKLENADAAHNGEDTKLNTKQRRKSRLQPTRISRCNECKENVSGCDSCQAKRFRLLGAPHLQNPLKDCSLIDIINTLDSDQEHGPAGGPAVRCNTTRTHIKSLTGVDQNNGVSTSGLKDSPRHAAVESSNEVYVTPAPYIDHEYSHCQAQLRRPEENDLVDQYNENYRIQKIKSLMQYHPLFRGCADAKLLDMGADTTYRTDDNLDYTEDGDDGFSSQEQDEYSDAEQELKRGRNIGRILSNSDNFDDVNYRRRGGSRRRSGAAHRSTAVRDGLRFSRSRIIARGSGGKRRGKRIGLSASFNAGGIRRSKRIIRAPRRPYDDFEKAYIDDMDENGDELESEFFEDDRDSVSMQSKFKRRHLSRGSVDNKHSVYSDSTNYSNEELDGMESDDSIPIKSHKNRIHYKRRKRHSVNHYNSSLTVDFRNYSSESTDDEEAKYLRNASKCQHFDFERDTLSSSLPHVSHALRRTGRRHRRGGVDMASVWNTLNWSLEQKRLNKPWVSTASAEESCDTVMFEYEHPEKSDEREVEDYEEVVEETEVKQSERTTVEAAHLLLGISQMQSFRRQSGYLSLDSSGTSPTLAVSTLEKPIPVPKATGSEMSVSTKVVTAV